ncbi:hypothetical protein [Paenibacillus sp. ACRRY]|uniref:hypothetical protein n=1 Tax=Paenibacillus sp. ACRRY TaxID=2918208 RepID=UPI001EF50C0F|nr:hypothetical protein [Paenibacillus sp. ACRRY]MCG7381854.1 hypothetical protein [Paenibacillus sp. ACRRY]
MARFLDGRVSINAPLLGSIYTPLPLLNAPFRFGQIGLQTQGAGANLRVQLAGTVSVLLPPIPVGITIRVVRGALPSDPVVYLATYTLPMIAPSNIITFSTNDFNPPQLDQLTYTAYISSNMANVVRNGPENFDGFVVSD